VLVDGLAKPGVDLPHEEFDPRGAVMQMEDEQRAAWLQDPDKFHERRLLVAAGFVHMFEHADTSDGVEHGV
jgi:hypothetical protein